ncbi:hypothetical protein P280DRAFT_268622 [Massarina eburnea CBS 473.64]|uniref:RING-type domain-containing protein n=1 Tax=Massarina eburnea CBS 473.64 TaxID=1395130 RepID=A0A6A6S4V2_9PLEO|nr:hypothetical protein P280DRAFT_268622 [Massarina eburnea CBS 473.64]
MPRLLSRDVFLDTCLIRYTPSKPAGKPTETPTCPHRSSSPASTQSPPQPTTATNAYSPCLRQVQGLSISASAHSTSALPPRPPSTSSLSSICETRDCPICLDPLTTVPNCVIIALCLHTFHEICLKMWLEKAQTCPICRKILFKRPAASARGYMFVGEYEDDVTGFPAALLIAPSLARSPLTAWVMEEQGRAAQRRRGSHTLFNALIRSLITVALRK